MKKGCIAVFAKTPGLSAIKMRLAVDIGKKEAESIFTACVDTIQETLQSFKKENPEWDIIWALGEENGPTHPFWKDRPFKKKWTGDGSLGTRLFTIDSALKKEYESVILIGTDCPHIPLSFLNHVLEFLSEKKMVIGPATDGGYYLFGSSTVIQKEIWESVPYSCDQTAKKFISLLNSHVAELPPLTDLDEKSEILDILWEVKDLNIKTNPILIQKLEIASDLL